MVLGLAFEQQNNLDTKLEAFTENKTIIKENAKNGAIVNDVMEARKLAVIDIKISNTEKYSIKTKRPKSGKPSTYHSKSGTKSKKGTKKSKKWKFSFPCDHCSFSFHKQVTLFRHLNRKHNVPMMCQ